MSHQGTIRRYTLIIEKVSRGGHPSLEDILDFLQQHGFKLSRRTLQRDVEAIRDEFGVELAYSRYHNGYFLKNPEDPEVEAFMRFLEIAGTSALLIDSLKDSKDTMSYISFEAQGNLKGIEYLKQLLFALKKSRKVTFVHKKFDTGYLTKYTVRPYLLKEYLNRWYLIAQLSDNQMRTFGLDRMSELEVTDKTFKPNKRLKPSKLFEHTIGLTYSVRKPEEIVLSFTAHQGNYIKTLPLHWTQTILKDNQEELLVRLKVVPNFELKQKILMYGDMVKIIEPKWFADELKQTLKNSLAQYKRK